MTISPLKSVTVALVSVILAACGGGGGGGGTTQVATESTSGGGQSGSSQPQTPNPVPVSSLNPPAQGDRPASNPAQSSGGQSPSPVQGQSPNPEPSPAPTPSPDPTLDSPPQNAPSRPSQDPPVPTPQEPTAEPQPAPFTAFLSMAPAQNEGLFDVVTLEVRGTGIRNVELVPPDSSGPVIARFNVVNDTVAVLHLDTRSMVNGVLAARILAYDAPPGAAGSVVEVMPTREWRLVNEPQPPLIGAIPPRNYRPSVIIRPSELPFVDPAPLRELYELDDAALSARLASDGPAIQALMDQYQTSQIWLEPTGIDGSGQGEWFHCRSNLTLIACRGGFLVMAARMEAKRP